MKKIVTTLGAITIAMAGFSQTVWIANNNTGAISGPNVKLGNTAIQDAIDVSANGDIIYVVPGGGIYNATNVNKSVSIFGAGFNPDKPSNTVTSCQNMTISANNVRLSGLVIGPIVQISTGFSGTLIDKCRVNRFIIGAVGSTIIQNCVFGENTSGQYSLTSDLVSNLLRISNNIIYGSNNGWLNNVGGAVIENNVFVGITGFTGNDAFNIVQACTIKNNIFLGVQPRGGNSTNFINNNQTNNLSFGATNNAFVSGVNGNSTANNIVGSDPLFVNLPTVPNPPFYNTSYDAHLQSASPAKGTGLGGIDMGVYGGATPFDPFGTSLPIVQTIVAPGSVFQGTNMNVQVKAKGN